MANKYEGKGYMGKILRVNLTDGKFSEEEPSDELVKNYIGGRGWGIKILYDELEPKIDPLGPENKMLFLTGPLTGTTAQSFARLIIAFKSPLTGIYYRSSAGGFFATEIKSAGLDAIIVEGKAEKPVYLWINDGNYEIKDATKLWGLDTVATQEMVKKDIGEAKAKVICIGPPGEKLVKISGMATDRRTASRAGGGAVMGSKNLKAIAVRGTNKVEVAMPDLYKLIVRAQVGSYNASAPLMGPGGFKDTGTRLLPFTNALGMYPTRNFREGILTEWPKLSSEEYMKIKVRSTGCHGCMIRCGSIDRIESGKYAGLEDEGPEYETIWAASGTIDVADIGFTVAMEKFCDDMAIDTISAGSAIAFAYELYEKGIITKEDTDGLELKYGDADVAMELLKKIANKEGFGAILAEGTLRAAQKIGKGAEKYAMQVKGLELPAYDPRGAKAHGLSMLTSNIGGSHCVGYSPQELFNIPLPRPVDPVAIEGKGRLTKYNQD
ncbi:MAG TPA: aldehyde ferredoxin oxidoreductase family protein, partial [Thermoplasmata archaeon]|nr:aldehyde ferredoxin oxidoreductase family protein [Thermoplasmata archaeon]